MQAFELLCNLEADREHNPVLYWHRPFRELSEVSQQVTYPEAAARCFGWVHRTDPLLCCPQAARDQERREGGGDRDIVSMRLLQPSFFNHGIHHTCTHAQSLLSFVLWIMFQTRLNIPHIRRWGSLIGSFQNGVKKNMNTWINYRNNTEIVETKSNNRVWPPTESRRSTAPLWHTVHKLHLLLHPLSAWPPWGGLQERLNACASTSKDTSSHKERENEMMCKIIKRTLDFYFDLY